MINNKDIGEVESLSNLNELIALCTRCPLYKTKTNDVPGSGNSKAKIMFIGEAPGKKEDLEGEPFIGAAGKFLTEMLSDIGLKRSDVFIANVLKHRPPNNRDPKPNEIEACWPHLAQQISIIKPSLIIFLGRHALNRFFPEAKISETHGQAFTQNWPTTGKEQTFLALYHPAAALYNGSMRETLKEDFKKIPALIKKIEADRKSNQSKNN